MMMKSDLKCTQNSKKKTAVDRSKRYPNVSAKTCSFVFINCYEKHSGYNLRSVHSNNQKKIVRTVQIPKHCFILFSFFFVLTFYEKKKHWGRRFFIKLHGIGLCTNGSTFIHKLDEVGVMQREHISRMQEIPWEKKKKKIWRHIPRAKHSQLAAAETVL